MKNKNLDKVLIVAENEALAEGIRPVYAMIFDKHSRHIFWHVLNSWRSPRRYIKHIREHIVQRRAQKVNGLTGITHDDIMKAINNKFKF